MKSNKKGVELSMTMIVIIALLLIVLIVAILIFSGGMESFTAKLKGINAEIWAAKPNFTGMGK